MRILIIDDDVDLLNILSNRLSELGHTVYTAASGKDGIASFYEQSPQITVVDFKMPGLSGMSVLEWLRDEGAPVIMLTGEAGIEVAESAMAGGAENFLTKSVAVDLLAAAIEKAAAEAVHQ